MPAANVGAWIRSKFLRLGNDLDERGRRRWAATEAPSVGRGGSAAVAEAAGPSERTMGKGIDELPPGEVVAPGRQRRPGAGRKSRAEEQPRLRAARDALGEPTSRGAPASPLRRRGKSSVNLADALSQQGLAVSPPAVGHLLKHSGSSSQAQRKAREGKDQPDRDAQFAHLNRRGAAYGRGGRPAGSGAPQQSEGLGTKKNRGREERPPGNPRAVDTPDFPHPTGGRRFPPASMTAWTTKPGSRSAPRRSQPSLRAPPWRRGGTH
jgi:Rhodopirellula transposase DDE domain